MYEKIPAELKRLKQWVCWGGEKLPKNPYTGGNAQSNNPDTWSDFKTACEAVEKFHFNGIGFMFAPPYFGVDMDDCVENQELIDEFVESLQSYTEYSTSGTGIHIICKGKLPEGARRKGKIEMYEQRRYFIMTGNAYSDAYTKIVDCTEKIKMLHTKYLYTPVPKVLPKQIDVVNMSDQDIIDKARSCKTGSLFQLLYSGEWQGIYSSQSEADMAFCNHLAFWTQKNAEQMDRIFRSSGLMRPKWDSKRGSLTYGELTIQKACLTCQEVYEPKPSVDDTKIAIGMFRSGDKFGRQDIPKNQYDMTDTGNAQRLRDRFKGNIRYSYTRRRWMYWTGKVWHYDETGEIKKLADLIVDEMKTEAFRVEDEKERELKLKFANKTANSTGKVNMITEAQHLDGIPLLIDELDCYVDYLNVQNGIVNLRNGELIPHDSTFMMSKICACEYDYVGEKKPKRWLQFLDEVTNGDKELQHYLQKCVGYSMTGSVREQCAFFLYGIGNNGKSTFLETVAEILGDYASNAQPDTIMMKKFGEGVGSDIARLRSARMVTTEEPTEGVRLNEGLIKQLTGGGKVTCRFLYGDEFEYSPEFKIWIATNHKPVITGTDVGIWRRIRLIPFEVNIPADKVDKQLKYKFREEMPQILRWAIEGCMLYRKEGLNPPKCVLDATQEYKAEMDLIATFMDACIVIDYNSVEAIPANELYSIYTEWARANNEYVMTSRKFFGEITKRTPDKKRVSGGIVYSKIRLTDFARQFARRSYSASLFH